MRIERVGDTIDMLGEGPLWDVAEQALYWVDSRGRRIRRLDWASGERRDWDVPAMIGSMALRESGGAILALQTGIHTFDFGTGEARQVVDPEADDPTTRFNDGKVDRQGRFLTGTMATRIGDRTEGRGSVYRLDTDLTLHRLKGGVIVANGPCFSPDGGTFYFADTGRRAIFAHDYDVGTGAIGPERIAVDTSPYGSGPDGGTVDSEGHLWSALVHTGQIARFAPDGSLERLIDMPCTRPASVMFGGPDLDVVFVPSIRDSGNVRGDREIDGALFAIRDLGITGIPEPRFAG